MPHWISKVPTRVFATCGLPLLLADAATSGCSAARARPAAAAFAACAACALRRLRRLRRLRLRRLGLRRLSLTACALRRLRPAPLVAAPPQPHASTAHSLRIPLRSSPPPHA